MEVIALGPWEPAAVRVRWRTEPYEPDPHVAEAAEAALAALAARGSPSHDSLAARIARVSTAGRALTLDLQPVRWSLRLVEGNAAQSLFVHCLVRDARGRWLAGRRSSWLAVLPGAWHLGAAGSVGAYDDPLATMRMELDEEWGIAATQLTVLALVAEPSGQMALIGLARMLTGAEPKPNDEHDRWAWWPADPARWPDVAPAEMREVAGLAGRLA